MEMAVDVGAARSPGRPRLDFWSNCQRLPMGLRRFSDKKKKKLIRGQTASSHPNREHDNPARTNCTKGNSQSWTRSGTGFGRCRDRDAMPAQRDGVQEQPMHGPWVRVVARDMSDDGRVVACDAANCPTKHASMFVTSTDTADSGARARG